jgi:outer membrane cobalamin receptor
MGKKLSFLLVGTLFCAITAFSQIVVKGVVLDKDTKEPLIGVTVYSETEKKGTATDVDGSFSLILSSAKGNLKFTYVGFKTLTLEASLKMGIIEMEPESFGLNDVIITSTIGVDRKTPVAMSTIDAEVLTLKTGSKEFPEMLKSTPGVYATKVGGGFGDSRVNIRGFSSENVAVMINGVPVNDMEWGGVYWSNWAGMTDVTRFMQVQRGLGASKVASPSVGGSINVVTRTTDAKKGGSIYYGTGDSGYNKLAFSISTGLLDSGWAVTLLGSKAWADGYIQGTQYETYTYFLNVSKKLSDSQTLSFTAFGAPQWHNQRKDPLLISEWAKLPESDRYRYNAGYGYDASGQLKTFNYNVYHKPMMSLNHVWDINLKSSLSTAAYLSVGSGGGYTGMGNTSANRSFMYGSTNGLVNKSPYRKDDGNISGYGTYDFAKLMADNAASENGSLLAVENSINNHVWGGILSTYSNKLSDEIEVQGGLDLRYYKGIHTAEVVDLLGGTYVTDLQRSIDGKYKNNPEWVNEKLTVGDIVYRDFDSFIMQEGVFGQAEYTKKALSVFVSGALNMTNYSRLERFTADNEKSSTKNKIGFSIKGGANYNLTENHNVFANIGYFSRTPYFSAGVFINSRASNAMNPDPRNEKVFSIEAGYGYVSRYLNAKVNAYYTEWNDKTMVKPVTPARPEDGTLNMTGVNALHQGIEIELVSRPVKGLELKAMGSLGAWKWNSNASGYVVDQAGKVVNNANGEPMMAQVNLKGIHVGNSAQTTLAFGADYELLKGLRVGLDYNFYGRNYADYAVGLNTYNGVNNFIQPWQMPSANLWDANLNYKFKLGGIDASFMANIDNLFDAIYIADATDGGDGKAETAKVYYGFGRTWRAGLKLFF